MRLLAITWHKTTCPINKTEISASGKFTKYSKFSLLKHKNCAARMLANARKDLSIPLNFEDICFFRK